MRRSDQTSSSDAQAHIESAVEAAKAGDPVAMLEALFATPALDGAKRWLQRRWQHLASDDAKANDALSDAVDSLYAWIRQGRHVSNPVAWLMKVADRVASKQHTLLEAEAATAPMVIDQIPADPKSKLDPGELRKRALEIARSMLPKLGQENIRNVMSFLFDAVEQGCGDISNVEIGEALGLLPNTVAKLKGRGFARLERAARDDGIAALEELRRAHSDEEREKHEDDDGIE